MSHPTDPRRTLRRPGPKPAAASKLPRWGLLEWFLIAQTFIPALLFLPGVNPIRTPIRVASFGVGILCWAIVFQKGTVAPGSRTFPSNLWLKLVTAWLLLSVFHPNTNSLWAGFAHAMLYISILSPAFWTPSTLLTPRQIGRAMTIMFVCNGLSALVGIGQVFRPEIFNPPVIPALADPNGIARLALTYADAAGRRISRPCGLTDQIGAAAGAGATAALVGLALALRPIGFFKRAFCLLIAFFGVAVIYYSQVRMILLMLVICFIVLTTILFLQRNYAQATLLGGFAAGLILVAFSWVAATSGSVVTDRFLTLFAEDPGKIYQGARGNYLTEAFQITLFEYPLGYGLGWWGQIWQFFADKTVPTKIWVEVMWPAWIVDGGIPLLVTYVTAVAIAMFDTLRVALRTKDRELGFWAAVVFASNLSLVATTFSYVTFVSSIGMQFWLLSAAIHAADARVRIAARPRLQPRPGPRTSLAPATTLPPSSAPAPGPSTLTPDA